MIPISQACLRAVLPFFIIAIQTGAFAATAKPPMITFGKWITVQWSPEFSADAGNDRPLALKLRPLVVGARVREFTLGQAHDVTDRLFIVRRAFRLNDSLPQESTSPPHWLWQRGGWLLVDRTTGHISAINLPEFDVVYSAVSWYRDYAAYCGISEDGKKVYAVVTQINRRKPILKKPLDGDNTEREIKDPATNSACPAPAWQRTPARVTFEPVGAPEQTFAIRGHVVDLITEEEDDEEAGK
jgi:hypothetical protein